MYHIGDITKFDYEFDPGNFYSLTTGGEAVSLDRPITKSAIFEDVDGSEISVTVIDKEHLNIGTYQRNLDITRINKIKEGRFYNALGHILVHEVKHNDKWYYNIVDGQHRAAANPSDKCLSIISNTIPEPILFAIANDKRTKKAASQHDLFHAEQCIVGSVPQKITKLFKDHFDIDLKRNPNHGSGQRGRKSNEEGIIDVAHYGAFTRPVWDLSENIVKAYKENTLVDIDSETETENMFVSFFKTIFAIWDKDQFNMNGDSAGQCSYFVCIAQIISSYFGENMIDINDVEIETFAEKFTTEPQFARTTNSNSRIMLYDPDNGEVSPFKIWVDTAVAEYSKGKRGSRLNKKDAIKNVMRCVMARYEKRNS